MRLLPLLDSEVEFAGQPAAGASEAVVGRLDEDAAGFLARWQASEPDPLHEPDADRTGAGE
ncbi:hypothetical protein [Streptomyces sp. NPDC086023]|uniref:hypothetical protein n=1 Tax=Streptomyces sp. NPDC086023 TaxID=3365746 RepID=UPI0037CD0609